VRSPQFPPEFYFCSLYFLSTLLACVAGAKMGGEGEGEKCESGSPNPTLFFPSSLSPTPFNAFYAGYCASLSECLQQATVLLSIKFVSQKFNQKFDDSLPLDSPCRHSVYWTVPLVSVLHGVHCPCTHNTHNVIKLTAVA